MATNVQYQQWLKEIRQAFVEGKPFDEFRMRPVILESWKRSRDFGVQMGERQSVFLSPEELEKRIKERKDLCEVAFPILLDLFEFTNGSGLLSIICDEDAYVLKTVGKRFFDEIPPQFQVREGCSRNERVVGTNGIGTALVTGKPLQVTGLEHFYPFYSDYTCSGAPIFGPDNTIVGVMCLAGPNEQSKIHTLGLAISIADIISRELKLRESQRKTQSAYNEISQMKKRLDTVFETVSSGIILLDSALHIVHVNHNAAKMLNCPVEEMTGRPVGHFFNKHIFTAKSIAKGIEGKYITYERHGQSLDLSVTVETANTNEYVIIIDTAAALHKKINAAVGRNAFFTFDDILGESPALRKALELARIAAGTPSTVMLSGESGTGKELFAHAIHNASARRNEPFIAINCGAIPKSLIESELFGYEGGSFTGAKREGCPGKFELADRGTLFLDEIGDMPFDVQSSLLRVLQSREIVRIGGSRTKKIDVRIIAATNKNLLDAVARQTFRNDLFYRLNVFGITVPPLRDRPEDIRILTDYFLRKYAVLAAKKTPFITEQVHAVLKSFSWPGNVRELENVLERAIHISDGGIDEHCLPDYIMPPYRQDPRAADGVSPGRGDPEASSPKPEAPSEQERNEKCRIMEVLQIVTGNINAAADSLRISRRTLYRKLKKYNITRANYYI
jgi:transcriptional regulator with PAS, ATPase and Fis domain